MNPEASHHRAPGICLALIALGVIISATAGIWMTMATPERVWSPEQAAELNAAEEAVHAARSSAGPLTADKGDAESTRPPALIEAERRRDELAAGLARAQAARHDWGRWGAAFGLALVVAGGIGYLLTRGT